MAVAAYKNLYHCVLSSVKFHTYVGVNSRRLLQNVFDKRSRVLNLVFKKKWNFSWTSPYLGKYSFDPKMELRFLPCDMELVPDMHALRRVLQGYSRIA